MLEEHRFVLARGATLLFVTNLVGILLATAVVLVLTRFAPLPRLGRGGWKAGALLAAATAAVALVAAPLTSTYLGLANNAKLITQVHRVVVSAVGVPSSLVVDKVTLASSGVTIHVSGVGPVPKPSTFETKLAPLLGPNVSVSIVHD